jgi:hypothetical protein
MGVGMFGTFCRWLFRDVPFTAGPGNNVCQGNQPAATILLKSAHGYVRIFYIPNLMSALHKQDSSDQISLPRTLIRKHLPLSRSNSKG